MEGVGDRGKGEETKPIEEKQTKVSGRRKNAAGDRIGAK